MTFIQTSGIFMAPQPAATRLGQISFINSLPVSLPLERGLVSLTASNFRGDPATLHREILQEQLDVSAMSSLFYLQHKDRLSLVPGLSISCLGPVGSVLFFSKVEPHKLDGRRIEVMASSATSTALLQILLAEQFGVQPELIPCSVPSLQDSSTAGALVIGDLALQRDPEWSGSWMRLDLGQWWVKRYSLPMVFAVWAGRSTWVSKDPQAFSNAGKALTCARDMGLGELFFEVLAEAARLSAIERGKLKLYYKRQLNFAFTERHANGLELFERLARKHGFLC